MGILVGQILKIALQVLAGVGLTKFADRWIKPKVPATYYPEEIIPRLTVPKVVLIVGLFVVAFMALRFIGKKLNVKLLK